MITISILSQLLSNAVTKRRDKSILYSRTAINVLLYCIYSNYFIKKIIVGIGLFGGLFHATGITKIFHIFFYIICAAILQLTAYYPRKILNNITLIKKGEQYKILEYSLIILFIISGAILLMSTNDLISMFLSIELQSYGLYILSSIYKNSELATRGGLTYFLLGGLSSCFILLGSSLLYANTATTNLDAIYIISSLSGSLEQEINIYDPNYINISLIIMTVGLLFKVSAAPFHFWSPDVYDAVPTLVTTFIAIVAKISIFIFLLELLHHTGRLLIALEFSWINSLLVSSLLSLIIGTVVGLTQNRIKRLFAYSTISHVGFILLALSIDSVESIQAFIFYLMQYSLSNLNVFIILLAIGYSYYLKKTQNKEYEELEDQNNSPIQLTKQLKGLFYLNPVLAISLAITIFSFAGIPPLVGFFGKQMVLSAALDSGYIFITIVAVLTSVISAVYYLNIIKEMFFFNGEEQGHNITLDKKNDTIILSSYLTISISVLTLGILLFIFFPKEILRLAGLLVLNLNNL